MIHEFEAVDSTQDIAHELAEKGAEAGTVVVARSQRAGRGRLGRAWVSEAGQGIWCTVIERPNDPRALDVLSLRVGLQLAEALEPLAGARVGLKWPNDLVIPSAARDLQLSKLGGILVEARWSGDKLAWVAIGVGINVTPPSGVDDAAGLAPGTHRDDALRVIIRAVRAAAAQEGPLTERELAQYAARDTLKGRRILSPAAGTATGVDHTGALMVETADGVERCRTGTVSYPETST
jgi:BirA family biotin operon repressor/biotin-[acetyl-CoA-carboxylase] ligase